MNKGVGATTGAAVILAAGALLRPAVIQPANTSSPLVGRSPAIALQETKSAGPWKASAQYWAPVHVEGKSAGPEDFSVSVTGSAGKVDAHMQISQPTQSTGCKDFRAKWGIPEALPEGGVPEITSIIAEVPDPERGHLQLDFDRTLDAVMQAASDNGYLGSSFWLPWKPEGAHDEKASGAAKTGEDAEARGQPGMVVLKSADANSYRRVIYLFLVGATPTQGVNGDQLSTALQAQNCLLTLPKTTLSLRDRDEMDLLLFNYSGAAASLREGVRAALANVGGLYPEFTKRAIHKVSVAGATSTKLVAEVLNQPFQQTNIQFHSFQEDTGVEEAEVTRLFSEGSGCSGIALLAEGGTAFGWYSSDARTESSKPTPSHCSDTEPLRVVYPRDISLLRNATAKESEKNKPADTVISPYLHFSLEDSNLEDSIPHFSGDDTPLSQEAQLMELGRQLARSHIHTIAISATNVLDEIFLAQFLHRACPDARLIFLGGGDLLLERGVETAPYVGSLNFSPYNLADLDRGSGTAAERSAPSRIFASSAMEAYYNAASFTFHRDKAQPLSLAGYPKRASSDVLRPLLWVTTVGRDGYYPLGLLKPCASDSEDTLPDLRVANGSVDTQPCTSSARLPPLLEPDRHIVPSMVWYALCIAVLCFSLAHGALLITASFWSAFTRDLAISSSDMPRRRAVYINIATVMLFCMAFVVVYPLFSVLRYSALQGSRFDWHSDAFLCALLTMLAAFSSLVATLRKTAPYTHLFSRTELYAVLQLVAVLTLFVVPGLWITICETNQGLANTDSYAGLFFSYRCLHPESGVSPLLPLLLLLLAWYLWGVCQTLRLRFSVNSRPQLPRRIHSTAAYPLYVSENELESCDSARSSCLYRNITCLLITREIVRRFVPSKGTSKRKGLDGVLLTVYFTLFYIAVMQVHVQSLDHFLWHTHSRPTYYEFLIRALLFPLMVIAVTGWVRTLFIWTSLRRGLLEPLERLPLRFAFTRLNGVGWMTMLRQGGLHEYWRDMARSTESMRQMMHNDDLRQAIQPRDPAGWSALKECYADLEKHVRDLLALVGDTMPHRRHDDEQPRAHSSTFLSGNDVPGPAHCDELNLMTAIEREYARCCELLLGALLIPYWNKRRTGLVESEPHEMLPISAKHRSSDASEPLELHAGPHQQDAQCVSIAEEFLALRYVALIRAVLVNLRYTMIFVSVAFVLAILAWNSYPFRPRFWVDCMFTTILITLGSGVIWVFAQMYRNPILSRITDTSANELGIEFYLRLATFGAVPLLTWLASQFPAIGNGLYQFLKPGLDVVK